MKLVIGFAIFLSWICAARAESFVFVTNTARFVISSNGTATSLIEKENGTEQLNPVGLPFAVVQKNGQFFPSSSIQRRGALFHLEFGASGISAEYSITTSSLYLVVQLRAIQGEGIQEIRLVQLSTHLPIKGGAFLNVEWSNEFAVSLMGLSDKVDTRIGGDLTFASLYPKFSIQGERVAIIAVPTSQFLKAVQTVEHDFQLPSPTISGIWAKVSPEVRTSYLFIDLTEANADDVIRYAKMGGFRYILIYSFTWAQTAGSYRINLASFPHGEAGLKAVIDKCHAAGLKVGMRMLTSLVDKNDPLVRSASLTGLLMAGSTTVAKDMSAQATQLTALSMSGFKIAKAANEVVIDDEILECGQHNDSTLFDCKRGFAGTKPVSHNAGAKLHFLVQTDGWYLADLRFPLAKTISDRISGLVNRVGFDMVYFDGGDLNSAQGKEAWYWVGAQQSQIWRQLTRDELLQGSGETNWTWHIFARGTCDDMASVAVKQWLDYHKIADDWVLYHDNFVPVDLGWVGFLVDAPDHPATMPDELEILAIRMLALNSPVGIQTYVGWLKTNGRSEEMLKMLGTYERLLLAGTVPASLRKQLRHGEWHMTAPGVFQPIHYDVQRMAISEKTSYMLKRPSQPLKFRLQVVPNLATIGDPANVLLMRTKNELEVRPPAIQDPMPGALVQQITFGTPLDLTTHRALAVELNVQGSPLVSGESPVLNLQLESGGVLYRDYYIDLDFRGSKTIVLPEPTTQRMLPEFRPASASYPFKSATQTFNYSKVDALNVRWMRYAVASKLRCQINLVEALQERIASVRDLEILLSSRRVQIPGAMTTGDYAEYWGQGPIRIFDKNNFLIRTAQSPAQTPWLARGLNNLELRASGAGNLKLTMITVGN